MAAIDIIEKPTYNWGNYEYYVLKLIFWGKEFLNSIVDEKVGHQLLNTFYGHITSTHNKII